MWKLKVYVKGLLSTQWAHRIYNSCTKPSSSSSSSFGHCSYSSSSIPFQIRGTLLTMGPVLDAYTEVDHIFDQTSVNQFMVISGDNNPIHHDYEYAKQTIFKQPIVHGILLSSLFSTLFGRTISSSIYIKQTLNFKKPVYVGKFITIIICYH